MNSLQQQARFDAFVQEFNCEHPHEVGHEDASPELFALTAGLPGLPELGRPPWRMLLILHMSGSAPVARVYPTMHNNAQQNYPNLTRLMMQ